MLSPNTKTLVYVYVHVYVRRRFSNALKSDP